MNRTFSRSILVVLVAALNLAQAAEDHSAHGAAPPAASDLHAGHAATNKDQPTESESRHVPPDPPQHAMHDMSEREMIELMGMDDTVAIGSVLFDELEWRDSGDADALVWDAQAWYGGDYDKVWLKSEGERADGDAETSNEVLWDHVVARWWSVQAGVRHDTGTGPARTWAAFGWRGLAPYWFELEATAYAGENGQTALRFSAEYELLLTQRLILQPALDFDLYGKDDTANGIGSGLADSELGLRLRYELRREFAPYVGVAWTRSYGHTAELAREAGHDTNDVQWLAGVRWWF